MLGLANMVTEVRSLGRQTCPEAWLAVLALVLAGFLVACERNIDVRETLASANGAYVEGDFNTAKIQLKKVLKQSPDHTEARLLLGQVSLRLGDAVAAEEQFRRALANESTVEIRIWLGRALVRQGRYDAALEVIETATADLPDKGSELLLVRGEAYLGKGQLGQAREFLNAAYRDSAVRGDAAVALAQLSYSEGKLEEAHRYASDATRLIPASIQPWYVLGLVEYRQGKLAQAEQAFSTSVERGRKGGPAGLLKPLMLLAEVRIRQGDLDSSTKAVEELLRIVPDRPEPYYLQALVSFQARDLEQADRSLRQALNRAPGHPPSVLLMGATQYAKGRYEDAATHLRRFVGLAPTHPQARELLVAAEMKLGRYEYALDLLEPMVEARSDDAQLLSMVARASLLGGDRPRAEAYYRQAREANPGNWALRSELAEVYLTEGAVDQAIAELQDAPAEEAEARILLVRSLAAKGRFDEAEAALEQMRKTEPDDPRWLIVAGVIEWMRGDRGAARSRFETALAGHSGYVPAMLALGRMAVEDGRFEEAERQFRSVLAAERRNSKAMVGMAQVSSALNRDEDAIRWLEQARLDNPGELSARLVLGRWYLRSGRVSEALEVAREAGSIGPSDPRALLLLARVESRAGNRGLSIKVYGKLAERMPSSPKIQLEKASVEIQDGRYADARKSIQRSRELAPDWPRPQVLLGQLQIREGQFGQALRTANELKESHPNLAAGYELEGDTRVAQDRPDTALAAYRKAFERQPSRMLTLRMASLLRQTGESSQALAVLTNWLRDHPEDVVVRQNLAISYQSMGKPSLAEREYRAVLEADPDNIVALNNLAWLIMERSPRDAQVYALRAYERAPESPAAADTLGWILLQLGDIEGGRPLLDKAAQRSEDPSIHYHRALALQKSGNVGEARRILSRLLREAGAFPERSDAEKLMKELASSR